MKSVKLKFVYFLSLGIVLSSCTVNLLPEMVEENPNSIELETKGKEILEKAYVAHGSEVMEKHKVYQFTATDDWQGMMAGMGKLWPQKNSNMTFKYVPNTFDGQVKFKDGETKGKIAGLQSWQYYENEDNTDANFDVENNVRFSFGMAAFQYFTELVGRMNNAEIIRYAGEKEFNGNVYEMVYVTWKSEEPRDNVDQYLLYINKQTSMLDYASYTLRDNYLDIPGAGMMYGTIGFSDYKEIDG
ncbi:MAG: hypothetical protein JKY42_11875, partial [Flavobacteriales bacterium]|nr:hypothetical protein [Flavobacteriales bacterium]